MYQIESLIRIRINFNSMKYLIQIILIIILFIQNPVISQTITISQEPYSIDYFDQTASVMSIK